MRKVSLIAGLLIVFLISMTTLTVYAQTTSDIQAVDGNAAAMFLKSRGLLQGDDSGNLMLDKNLTRQEMVVIISRLQGAENEAMNYPVSGLTFKDVAKDNWAAPYIAWAKVKGITEGYSPDQFGYGDELTYWQANAFLVRVLGYTNLADDQILNKASGLGIATQDELNGNTKASIIRGDMAKLMYRALYSKASDNNVLGERLGILGTNFFSIKTIKVGDKVAGMTAKSIQIPDKPDATNQGVVEFTGETTITGTYQVIDININNLNLGPTALFVPDSSSVSKIPQMNEYYRSDFIFKLTNFVEAQKAFGPVGSSGQATIVIDDATLNYNGTSMFDTATLVKTVDVKPNTSNTSPTTNTSGTGTSSTTK